VDIFRRYKTFDEIVPGFLLEKEGEVQTRSMYPYNNHTRVFSYWLKEKGYSHYPLRKITPQMMADFFFHIGRGKGLDRTTCEKYFVSLRALWKYCVKWGEATELPFSLISFPRKKKDQGASMIQRDDMKTLMTHIKEKDPQLFLACNIQFYCFIRPGKELRLLRIGDIDMINGMITIRQEIAKNKRKQSVTMPQQLIDLCYEYGIDKADKNLFVFGTKRRFNKKPCSVNMLRCRFNAFRDELNLPKAYKFYSFKHTGASLLHMSGISMRELMDQLRHTNLSATAHYLKKQCGLVNERIKMGFPNMVEL
jgi:integrase